MPVNSLESYIVVRIDEVDIAKRIAHCVDKTNSTLQAFFLTHNGIYTIPAQGEKWLVKKIGNYWHLEARQDSTDEHEQAVATMYPGDSRIGGTGQTSGWGEDLWGGSWGSPAASVHFGTARVAWHNMTPIPRQIVMGSHLDGSALKSLISALEQYGLIIDATWPKINNTYGEAIYDISTFGP